MKKFAFYIHRYLGCVVGIVVLTVCITGCILVLEDDIKHLLEPDKYYVQHNGNPLVPLDQFVKQIEESEKEPEKGITVKVNRIRSFANVNRSNELLMTAFSGDDSWNYILYANPYTAQVCGYYESDTKTQHFFQKIKQIHRFLGLPVKIGRPIVGISTLIFIVVLLSGLIRWIPLRWHKLSNWKKGLTISFNKGSSRLCLDLHNTLGFYTLIPVLCMALTGLWWSFNWYSDMTVELFRVKPLPDTSVFVSKADPLHNSTVSLQQILDSQKQLMPKRADREIILPDEHSQKPITIKIGGGKFFDYYGMDTFYWNRYNGELLGKIAMEELSFGQKLPSLILPLHSGTIYGTFTRYLYFVACLLTCVVVTAGYYLLIKRWCNGKRRKNTLPDRDNRENILT